MIVYQETITDGAVAYFAWRTRSHQVTRQELIYWRINVIIRNTVVK